MKPTKRASVTVSDAAGHTVTSRKGWEIAAAVDSWADLRPIQEIELLVALRIAVEDRDLYMAGCICDDLKLNFTFSYPGEQEP